MFSFIKFAINKCNAISSGKKPYKIRKSLVVMTFLFVFIHLLFAVHNV